MQQATLPAGPSYPTLRSCVRLAEIDECESSPCGAYGICSDELDGYTCACDDGYAGTHCDEDSVECASSPYCGNGTCVDSFLSYSCVCDAGFSGPVCDKAAGEAGARSS